MTRFLRSALLNGIHQAGGSRFARALHAARPRILAYHGVDRDADHPSNFDGFQVPLEIFEEQMNHLARGYHVVPLAQIIDHVQTGSPVPDHAVALTFDDGYRNNLEYAAPVLKRHGFPATFFLTTGFIDRSTSPWWYRLRAVTDPDRIVLLERHLKGLSVTRREQELLELGASADVVPYPFLTWPHARTLQQQGFSLGAHTAVHSCLAAESRDDAVRDVRAGIERMKEEGLSVEPVLAYPYGRLDDIPLQTEAFLTDSGCKAGLSTIHGWARQGEPTTRIARLNITGHHRGASFAALVSGLRSLLPG